MNWKIVVLWQDGWRSECIGGTPDLGQIVGLHGRRVYADAECVVSVPTEAPYATWALLPPEPDPDPPSDLQSAEADFRTAKAEADRGEA